MTDQEWIEARLEAAAKWLREHGAINWVWPDSQGRFDTGLPAPAYVHPNAHKTVFTPPPGCANARHKRRQRALSNRSGRLA
jgi:hypothetical protein